MKLTLTEGELMAIINEKFNLQLKYADLLIEKVSTFGNIYEKAIRDTLAIYGSLGLVVFPDKKIAAIKHLRELLAHTDCGRKLTNGNVDYGIGLMQAKIAIERPMETIAHAHRFDEPKSSY